MMDLFGIRMYIEHMYYRFKKWLKIERGTYTNRDLVVDQLQIVVLSILLAKVFL